MPVGCQSACVRAAAFGAHRGSVAARRARRHAVVEKAQRFVLLERVDGGAGRVADQQRADVAGVQREGDDGGRRARKVLAPQVGQAERRQALAVNVVREHLAGRGTEEGVVERGIRVQRRDLGRQRVRGQQALRLEAEDGHVVARVEADQLVGAEVQRRDGGPALQRQHGAHARLAEDVDLAGAELGVGGADGEQRLHRVVGEARNLRVDAEAGELRRLVSSEPTASRWKSCTWSTWKTSGAMLADRSAEMPVCFPRRR